MKSNDALLIKCFGMWWAYDQSWSESPPQLPQDLAEIADIVYYPPTDETIKNRYNEDFSAFVKLKLWVGEELPNVESDEFNQGYFNHVTKMHKRMGPHDP